jgi:hypothetical protein
MKHRLLLFFGLLACSPFVHAQTTPFTDDAACIEKCSHGHLTSRLQQVTYFQYPSMDKYDLKYLKLDLNAETNSRVLSGTAYTESVVLSPLDSFITELRANMTVDSVFINGVKKIFTQGSDHVFIPLSPALAAGTTVTALFYYQGTANGSGVYAGTVASNGLNYTATLSESYQAREWFPIKQFLKDKIDSADIWVTTSAVNKVGSNGLLQGVDPLPGGKVRYRWKSRHPMNYYMPSIAVGNYMEYLNYAKPSAMAPDSILVQHFIADNDTYFNSVKTNLDKTPVFIETYSDLFGIYPFSDEKYGHAQANIGGGMEHQTMSTMVSFGSTLIAHELGHQWWGDHVTCARWNDIWLNEGFASYCEYLAVEKLPALFLTTNPTDYMQNIHNSVMSSPTGSVYVPDASIYNEGRIFSGRLSYNKGSAIIHNLRFEMQSDSIFFHTLQNYQSQFRDSVATAEDFRQVAEATAGRSFSDFFDQWYYGEGYPTFNITYYKPTADSIYLLVNEAVSAPLVTPFFKGYIELKLNTDAGDTTILINLSVNNQVYRLKTNRIVTGIVVDPNNWMLNLTGVITGGVVVPVRFTKLEGNAGAGCTYELKWETEQEQQIDRYEVEYSSDGIQFNMAGTVMASVAANGRYQYNYGNAGGILLYFRIKSINQNGSTVYSPVITVNPACGNAFSVSLSPNPVDNLLKISIQQPAAGKVMIRLLNSTGQLLRYAQPNFTAGINTFTWQDMQKFPGGTYLVQIQNEEGKIFSKKFVKK